MRALCIALFVAGPALAGGEPVVSGEVVHVADGDTITVRVDGRRRKLRLAGIDAPDLRQPHGTRARKALGELVFGREVHIAPVPGGAAGTALWSEGGVRVERGPVRARIRLGAVDVAAEMLRDGHAWVARDARDRGDLMAVERAARAARRGLWAGDGAVPPWEWAGRQPAPEAPRVYCTQDVRQCPDGSWVSRQPPGCRFAQCPGPATDRRDRRR